MWRVHAKDTVVDLDDLSSGEKSIIQIFYPLVEAQIKEVLREVQGALAPQLQPEFCVLIDEPELHLHPNLQVKVFDYPRLLTTRGRMQVIVATHSPTIVEYASFDELYLLRPVETVAAGDNQLVQIATDDERLQFLREVFGTTSNLTALQPVVVVEGIAQIGSSRSVSDRKLYRALHPGFDRVTVVAGGGKADCIRLRKVLETALHDFSAHMRAIALLDRDLTTAAPPAAVTYLPVSMIENFLLDPHAIWEALQSVVEKTGFKSVEDVSSALDVLLDSLMPEEVERRVVGALGRRFFQPTGPLGDIPNQAQAFAAELLQAMAPDQIATSEERAQMEVSTLKSAFQRREHFQEMSRSLLNLRTE